MNKLIDWFLSLEAVQARLRALGWKPPAGPVTQGGGGHGEE